ncbi:uncharacterized protein LOC127862777 isoform X2 [Dreissena polymorpha]|uniref:uncharacterized protein LOC127862777 isoform X2 n=1 Tax=Dreissena polymorpha TaxID=45954 RepID=UPI002263EFEB|nr:uncharacterized protein LOC127862777 isoform X2 [Dreissena polymorpha]
MGCFAFLKRKKNNIKEKDETTKKRNKTRGWFRRRSNKVAPYEPPAAPEVNIRLTKDGCAFEVRVEIEKKPLLPTLKDRIPLLEEEMRLRLASIEARKRAERRARNTATKRAVREVVPPEQRRKNLKKLHKRCLSARSRAVSRGTQSPTHVQSLNIVN